MDTYQKRLLSSLFQFKKLRFGDAFPGITFIEYSTLSVVKCGTANRENIRISMVADILQAPSPAVSRTMNSLEEKGLVKRSINTEDRRSIYVEMTPRGDEILMETDEILNHIFGKVYEKMGEEKLENLISELEQFYILTKEELVIWKSDSNMNHGGQDGKDI